VLISCIFSIAASPNGWTDTEVTQEYFEKVVEPETALIAKGHKRLVVMDGHNSHCTLKLAMFAESKGIVILILPPHTTHRLQPLDVGVFSHLSHAWASEVKRWSESGYVVSKSNLITIYDMARKRALTKGIICAAFRKCGIEPYDPSVITEEDMAMAEKTSILASLPIPPTLPAFMEVVHPAPPDQSTSSQEAPTNSDHPIESRNPTSQARIIPLQNVTNLPKNRPLHGLNVCQTDLPPLPSKFASKRELWEYVGDLAIQHNRSIDELAAAFAREVLANAENGRIRQQLHGNKPGRAKTTHIRTGARILTAADSIHEMCEADRKKVLGTVMKEMGPLMKRCTKTLATEEKETEAKLVRAEAAEIKAAADPLKDIVKKEESVKKKLKTAEDRFTTAKTRRATAKTLSAQRMASEACQKFQLQVTNFNTELNDLNEQKTVAQEHYNGICNKQDERLAAMAAKEMAYNDAIEEEEREKEAEKGKFAANLLRRAKLPQRPKEPLVHWQEKLEKLNMIPEDMQNQQEDYFLPAFAVRNAPGSSLCPPTVEEFNQRITAEVSNHLSIEHGDIVDSVLIEESAIQLVGRYGGGRSQEPAW
jgi:uncharacterized membrane protein